MKVRIILGLVVALSLVGCGGGDDGSTSTDAGAGDVPSTDVSVPTILGASDLQQVCVGGTIASTPEYDKSAKGPHPLIAFSGEAPDYTELTLDFPEGWAMDFLAYETAELVACLDRVDEELVKTCEGYTSDESEEEFSVDLYNATYDTTVYAAKTGEEVVSGKIEATDKECPYIAFFDEGEKTQRQDADPSADLAVLVKKFVAP